jgi:adenosine deaminase
LDFPTTVELIKSAPKVELHLHLEGAIPLELLSSLMNRDEKSTIRDEADLHNRLAFSDFSGFVRKWTWAVSFIKEERDFELIAYEVLRVLSEQNVKYVEVSYSPGDYVDRGLSPEGITESILRGRERASLDFGIKSQLIVDLVRNYGPEYGRELIERVSSYLGKGLVGIGLGGSEQRFPPDPYEEVYREAKELGFRLTAHAGEESGADSIWSAIKKLGAERVGHGLRAFEDPNLLTLLRAKQIPLEMCPTSNTKTGVWKSFEDHPIKRYFLDGLAVTVNSDDPTFFDTSLTDEYVNLVRRLGFTLPDVRRMAINGVMASFASNEEKERMLREFEDEWEKLGS